MCSFPRNGLANVFCVAELVDLDSGMAAVPPRTLKTLTVHRSLAPDWLETATWADIPLPAEALAVRVKVLNANGSMPGFVTAQPMGEVLLPLTSDDPHPPKTRAEAEAAAAGLPVDNDDDDGYNDPGLAYNRDLWWTLQPSAKMKKAPKGDVQVRLKWDQARRFDCAICGRSSTKEEMTKHRFRCRVCGARVNRQPNPRITEDEGAALRLAEGWLAKRHSGFAIPRKPLDIAAAQETARRIVEPPL